MLYNAKYCLNVMLNVSIQTQVQQSLHVTNVCLWCYKYVHMHETQSTCHCLYFDSKYLDIIYVKVQENYYHQSYKPMETPMPWLTMWRRNKFDHQFDHHLSSCDKFIYFLSTAAQLQCNRSFAAAE